MIVGRPSSLDFRERRPMCSPVIPAWAGMTVRCCQNQDLRDLWDGQGDGRKTLHQVGLRLAPDLPSAKMHPDDERRAVGPRSPIQAKWPPVNPGCGWPPISHLKCRASHRLKFLQPIASKLRLAPDLPSAKMRCIVASPDLPSRCGCGWPPISHRLKSKTITALTTLSCGWPPISHRLKFEIIPLPTWSSCGWPPISHRLKCTPSR